MRALSTSPMASVNLRFDKNFGFSPYGNICTCFPEIVYFSTRNMLPKTSKVFTCENGEDCLNLNGAKYAKLVDLEKWAFRCKNGNRYSRQRTSAEKLDTFF